MQARRPGVIVVPVLAVSWALAAAAPPHRIEQNAAALRTSVIDNARVRVITAASSKDLDRHPAAVVVALEDSATAKAGDAYWTGDLKGRKDFGTARLAIVEPKTGSGTPSPAAPSGSKPGDAPFKGMSFVAQFENDRVAVIRARMDVGATEGFHTHGADTIVVYLSDGTIEDTADGRTTVRRWKRGDVEFEAKGSSHSARNLGAAVDAVLVTLKP